MPSTNITRDAFGNLFLKSNRLQKSDPSSMTSYLCGQLALFMETYAAVRLQLMLD